MAASRSKPYIFRTWPWGRSQRAPTALAGKKEALQRLQAESGGANLSETMWLKSEVAAAEAALKG
jgi:hypothetical protein